MYSSVLMNIEQIHRMQRDFDSFAQTFPDDDSIEFWFTRAPASNPKATRKIPPTRKTPYGSKKPGLMHSETKQQNMNSIGQTPTPF